MPDISRYAVAFEFVISEDINVVVQWLAYMLPSP